MEKEKKSINLVTLILIGIVIVLIIIGLVVCCMKVKNVEEKYLKETAKLNEEIETLKNTSIAPSQKNFLKKISYIDINVKYNDEIDESEIEVVVNDNNVNDSVGRVKVVLNEFNKDIRDYQFVNLKGQITDLLVDYCEDGYIYTITFLTSEGKAYTTPWLYRYDNLEAEVFEMGKNVIKLDYDSKGACGYNKDGEVVCYTDDVYADGY